MAKKKSGARGYVRIEGLEELEEKLRRLGAEANQLVKPGVKAGGETWLAESRRMAPGPGVDMEVEDAGPGKVEAIIGPLKEKFYYLFFETGTQAHEIKVKNRKAMRIKLGDEVVFFKRAQHGGMAAKPFLKPPFTQRRTQIVNSVREVWKRIADV